ncbi:hypothetical protein GCM10007886_19350 [Methylobacterium gregans]|uniref:Uncharacterized protein n=1 Tax=Methylobacterium gregans TaxID=374424 RepID=A0AA37MCV6_9HYPH|nr:hypothetical protein [Methylobacterium gregans]MDQ0519073.1 hypothetical protein [Methylobacterium gregans]GJD80328.1 hypothetical protein NBEOAGPD_3569 [Methylobacterium gregans]GLS53752.1 hypothetical protein GCM10007886_19350 [Methylobacterium gregans]
MSRLPSPRRLRGFGLLALMLAGTAAQAADFDGAYRPRPDFGPGFEADHGRQPPPPPRYPRFSAAPELAPSPCRVFVKRRFDADGEPVIRRVRVCDEPDDLGPPRRPSFDPPPPDFPRNFPDEPRGRWGGPRW